MIKKIILMLLFFMPCAQSFCMSEADSQKLFLSANELYAKGEFEAAKTDYERILEEGFGGLEVYFNLGNCYYKLGRIGRARMYYEKALKVSPRDPDLKSNLNLIKSSIISKNRQKAASDIILDYSLEFLNINEVTILLLVVYLIFFGILTAELFTRSFALSLAKIISIVLLVFAGIWWYGTYNRQVKEKYAIITANQAQVLSGPGENFTVGFTVPEGEKALILKKFERWYEIGIKSEGLRGWIKEEELGFI